VIAAVALAVVHVVRRHHANQALHSHSH
jgi:hypothetical protein